jgi:hypothetical protein
MGTCVPRSPVVEEYHSDGPFLVADMDHLWDLVARR